MDHSLVTIQITNTNGKIFINLRNTYYSHKIDSNLW